MRILVGFLFLGIAAFFGYGAYWSMDAGEVLTSSLAALLFSAVGLGLVMRAARIAFLDWKAPRLPSTYPKLPRIVGHNEDGGALVEVSPQHYRVMDDEAAIAYVKKYQEASDV